MAQRGTLTILRTYVDGENRLYGVIGHRFFASDFWGNVYETGMVDVVGILDFAAGRAFTLTGDPIGEDKRQAMIDGVSRILEAGGWPRLSSEKEGPAPQLPMPTIRVRSIEEEEIIDL